MSVLTAVIRRSFRRALPVHALHRLAADCAVFDEYLCRSVPVGGHSQHRPIRPGDRQDPAKRGQVQLRQKRAGCTVGQAIVSRAVRRSHRCHAGKRQQRLRRPRGLVAAAPSPAVADHEHRRPECDRRHRRRRLDPGGSKMRHRSMDLGCRRCPPATHIVLHFLSHWLWPLVGRRWGCRRCRHDRC